MITRRDFLAVSSAAIISPMTMAAMSSDGLSPVHEQAATASSLIDWSYGMKPIFCVAYIDPGIESQKGQEKAVAKFPVALVPQDDRDRFKRWRDKVRKYNPDIKLLGYQMVIEETGVPGPGHRRLAKVENAWVEWAGGYQPTVTYRTNVSGKRKRIYDPRSEYWQTGFVESCKVLAESGEFDGLFLDQCTVYLAASPLPAVRADMRSALNSTLIKLRAELPDSLIIGNSSYSWPALNGEMNEGRPKKIGKEFQLDMQRKVPRMELFQYYSKGNMSAVAEHFRLALKHRAFFGSSVNAQTAQWLDVFDEILSEYQIVN